MARKRSNVFSLRGAAPPVAHVEPRVMVRLQELIAKAKDGQVVGIAWVALDPFGCTNYGRAGSADADRMIASAARLLHDMLADDRDNG